MLVRLPFWRRVVRGVQEGKELAGELLQGMGWEEGGGKALPGVCVTAVQVRLRLKLLRSCVRSAPSSSSLFFVRTLYLVLG